MKKDIMGLHLNKLESEIMNDYTSEDNEEIRIFQSIANSHWVFQAKFSN